MTSAAGFAITGAFSGWAVIGFAMIAGRRRSHGAEVRRRSAHGLIGIALQGIGFAIVFGWRRPPLGASAVDWGLGVVSVLLAWSGAAFVWWAFRALGRQWSLVPRVVEGHALIDRGPYAIVRHPIYLGMLGLLVATGLALGPSGTVLAAVAFYVAGTLVRIRMEEALLAGLFGDAYRRYAARVPAFLPFPRPSRR
jgi:protein-S-isoprenylcysteine O-methyltransferase Ste14